MEERERERWNVPRNKNNKKKLFNDLSLQGYVQFNFFKTGFYVLESSNFKLYFLNEIILVTRDEKLKNLFHIYPFQYVSFSTMFLLKKHYLLTIYKLIY